MVPTRPVRDLRTLTLISFRETNLITADRGSDLHASIGSIGTCYSPNSFFVKKPETNNIQIVAEKIDQLLKRTESADLSELMSIWRSRLPEEGSGSPALFRCLGERILAHGEPLLAYDVVTAGLATWPKDTRLRQLQGLALARSGATDRANAILEDLRREAQPPEETLGMLGRTYKDLAIAAATPDQRDQFLKRAAETYAEAYRTSGGYWSGINAATMNLLVGQTAQASELAQKVRKQCLKELKNRTGDSYWEFAALGEAALILHDLSQATEWYSRAANEGRNRFGDLQSSRRNARLVLQHWNEDPNWIDSYLRIPAVIVFAGHMIDRPGRATPRFAIELEPLVAKEIRQSSTNWIRASVFLRPHAVPTFYSWKRCSSAERKFRSCCRTTKKNLFATASRLARIQKNGVLGLTPFSHMRPASLRLQISASKSAVFRTSSVINSFLASPLSAAANSRAG